MSDNEEFIGYLTNVKSFSVPDSYNGQHIIGAGPNRSGVDSSNMIACLLLYFYTESPDQEGNVLKKAIFKYEPYFYVVCKPNKVDELQQYLFRSFEEKTTKVEVLEKVDLSMPNHLAGLKKKVIKLSFKNVQNLLSVRGELRKVVQKNKAKEKVLTFSELLNPTEKVDLLEHIEDLREDDVQYHVRVCIDNDIRCGKWYKVKNMSEIGCTLTVLDDKVTKNPVSVLAFDIETTKAPLKFPDPRVDSIMLISYMIDGDGYLITNRNIIPEDIEDFQYTPKPEFDGHFQIFNEKDEEGLLKRFVMHCKEVRPNVFVSFNGDMFDIPFIGERLKVYGMSLEKSLGLQWVSTTNKTQYAGRYATHIDCLHWVERDSYLPQGSHGLKAVTREKLGYEPIEVDPEKMVQSARETPKQFCAYSVSDALATYHLYRLMIHDFIFALCTIIPTNPDEVLRAGSGTLCEDLLMTQAFKKHIIFPAKQVTEFEKFHNSNLIDSETYSGGHVECLNVGIYRDDIKTQFNLDPSAYQELIDSTENYIKFNVEIQDPSLGYKVEDVVNYKEVVDDIKDKLNVLLNIANTNNEESLYPMIYHLDVGAMYPNIILTNKLQPVGVVNDEVCAKCLYNKDVKFCKKKMFWRWRGELFPLTRHEYESVKKQLEFELYHNENNKENNDSIEDISIDEFKKLLLKRIKTYCSKNYKKIHQKVEEDREGYVCQRENPFYVDAVRDFRDRRYTFKAKVKEWKNKLEAAVAQKDSNLIMEAKNCIDLYDSLQLAHKIILNSFYGYVMRKGSRWYSMEMAAMVTYQGSHLITDARLFCQKIGKPLELDTDGIWCCLPKGFPETYNLKLKNGKKMKFIFSQAMLNTKTYYKYHNNQYNELDKDGKKWIVRPEMSIFFEPDGPYKCMVLPAAKEEGKTLKKRYIVITKEGKMSELKGFELKRRGELKIIKIFQADVFKQFLKGNNLKECYNECAVVAKRWYSILQLHGKGISDEELLEYIEESRNMSKSVEEYGAQKSTSITCAKRMADILGEQLLKEKNLCSKFIISRKPLEAPIAERAIPTIIFKSQGNIRKKLLRKWLKDYTLEEDVDMREVIDWEYYKERLAGNILKIVIIPAAIQRIENPFPDIAYPDWVSRMMARKTNQQKSLNNYFSKNVGNTNRIISVNKDIEDIGKVNGDNYEMDGNDNEDWESGEDDMGSSGRKKKSGKKKKVNNNINLGDGKAPTKKKKIEKIDIFLKKREDIEMEDQTSKISNENKENEPMINIADNFQGWLNQQKKFWKKFKPESEAEKNLNDKNLNNKSKNIFNRFGVNIENSFKKNPIYIIQATENPSSPGIMKLWVYFGNYFMPINVKIRRKIYINSLQQDVPDVFKKVNLFLPRNKPLLNLYEFKLEEKDFKEKFNNFNDYIVKKSIEGVYETKIPLTFEIIKNYGNCIVYKNNDNIHFNPNTIFNFEDFEPKYLNKYISEENDVDSSNLSGNLPENNLLYLYHSCLKYRHFIILVDFSNSNAYAFIVDSIKYSERQIPNIKNLIAQNMMQIFQENGIQNENMDFSNFNVLTRCYTNFNNAYKELNKIMLTIKYGNNTTSTTNITNKPIVLALQTYNNENIELLNSNGLTCIQNDFPVLLLNFDKEENNFPALDWIKYCTKLFSEHISELYNNYEFRKQLGQYCSIPICNIIQDSIVYCCDLIFSRVLNASKRILWYSEGGFPDLGGGDITHDFFGELEYNFSTINNPGLYLGYSAEINITCFCVNAILESERLKDFSGTYELQYVDKNKKEYLGETHTNEVNLKRLDEYYLERDEFALGASAFIALKKMLEKWYEDVIKHEDICADTLLRNFNRWISSNNSKFFDPVVFRMINLLMQKFFSLFLSKITGFGYEVVYADTKKIIIFNHKQNFDEFQLCIDSLIKSIKKETHFEHIILEVNQYWKVLLYRDQFNYSSIVANDISNQNEIENDENNLDISPFKEGAPKIFVNWTLAKFLPKVLKSDFISLTSDYLIKLYKFFYIRDKDFIINIRSFYENKKYTIQQANELVEKLESNNEQENEEAVIEFKSFLIRNYISYKMFDMLPNIQLKKQGYEEEEEAFIDDDRNMIREKLRQNKDYNSPQKLNLDLDDENKMEIDEEQNDEIANGDAEDINEEAMYRREDFEDGNNYEINDDDDDNEEEENNNSNKYFEDAVDKKDKQRDTDNYKQVGNNNKGLNINLNMLKKLEKQKNESIWKYPTCLGTYDIESRTNLASEYINYICEILGLDKSVEQHSKILKINCDKFIHVEECSRETIFRDPCRTFVLRDIYCEYCYSSIDIDFCRDKNYLQQKWECADCHMTFDKNMVEFLVVKKIQKFIDAYFNQDLECTKCKEQKNEPLFTLCPCAGKFKGTFNEEFRKNYPNMNSPNDLLQIMKDIANYYDFKILGSLLNEVI